MKLEKYSMYINYRLHNSKGEMYQFLKISRKKEAFLAE